MKLCIEISAYAHIRPEHLLECIQLVTLDDCKKIVKLEVDESIWFNEILSAYRPE